MSDRITDYFVKDMGEGIKYANVSHEIRRKYQGVFLGQEDKEDILINLWSEFGLRKYKNGLFWLVNPELFNDIARSFSVISNDAIVFARSALGGLFLWEKYDTRRSIFYFNIHKCDANLVANNFDIFFEWNITSELFWKDECYGKMELKAVKKYPDLKYDECVTFVPALALGGEENAKAFKRVKMIEQLEFLSQIHSAA